MTDQNKPPQNLSPDLKQIYDRVMNTPAKGGATPTPPPPAQAAPVPPQPKTPATDSQNPPSSVPAGQKVAAPSDNPSIQPQPPIQSAETSQPFLTSAPPRPLQGSVGVKSFALGKDKKEEPKAQASGEKKGLSKTLIIILAVIFFVAWSFFWVVFFFNPFA